MAGSRHHLDIVPVDLVDELLDQEAPSFKQRLHCFSAGRAVDAHGLDGPARAGAAMGKRMPAPWLLLAIPYSSRRRWSVWL